MAARVGHTALTWDTLDDPAKLEACIRDCAELGFAGTETAGMVYEAWEERWPGRLKQILDEHGVELVCLFQFGEWTSKEAAPALIREGRRYAEAVKELGGSVLMVVPGSKREMPPYSLNEYRTMADTMNRLGRIATDAGVVCTMHPHWGTTAETRLEIELLLSLLDPENVYFAPDCGQIAKGGADPSEVVRPHAQRVRHVHLKDVSPEWEEMTRRGVPLRSPEGYAALGEGVVDVKRFVEVIMQDGFDGWLMCELDQKTKATAREDAAINKRFMDQLGL